MATRRETALLGESCAARFLEARGWRVAARNWRTQAGEIDIVAFEGRTLVFVEVKTRRAGSLVEPCLAVDHVKQRKLRRLAGAYLALEGPRYDTVRFDVVGVVAGPAGPPLIEHIPDAF